jgi:hypothetical protein
MGTYTIQATTTWELAWTANSYTGTLDTTRTTPAATPLIIGQLRAVIISVNPPPNSHVPAARDQHAGGED